VEAAAEQHVRVEHNGLVHAARARLAVVGEDERHGQHGQTWLAQHLMMRESFEMTREPQAAAAQRPASFASESRHTHRWLAIHRQLHWKK
jgi:hypothetical protein